MSDPTIGDVPEVAQLLADRLPAGRPSARLIAAASLADQVSAAADALLIRVVGEARAEGQSWTEIGDRLGVSKQAARKRFAAAVDSDPSQLPSDLCVMPRLTTCLQAARLEAADDSADVVGDQHLLLGLFTEGMAANALHTVGLTLETTRAAARRLFPTGAGRQPGAGLPEITSGQLASAAAFARDRGSYLGTEHLLCVLADDPGSRTRGVLNALGVSPTEVIEHLVLPPPRRRRLRRMAAARQR